MRLTVSLLAAPLLLALTSPLLSDPVKRTPYDEQVMPSVTDPAIKTFDFPHGVDFPNPEYLRNQLLLFLDGTNPSGEPQRPGAIRFTRLAAYYGYHVIYLMYPNDVSAAEVARDVPDKKAFATFRWDLIEGGKSGYARVPRPESIENRAIKLLAFLQHEHPDQNWGQFLEEGHVAWEKVAVAGQSQGGGHAAIIATRYLVARVICFGAPKDFNKYHNEPAEWYHASVTPPERYFAFNNPRDYQGCSYPELVQNLEALDFQKSANVDKELPPYHGAHALFTDWPGKATDSRSAHTAMINGSLVDKTGAPIFKAVWRYMLTAPTDSPVASQQ